MSSTPITETVTIESDDYRVYAIVRHGEAVMAKERVPRQYVSPTCDPERAREYFEGVCRRLMARIPRPPKPDVKEDNGKALDIPPP